MTIALTLTVNELRHSVDEVISKNPRLTSRAEKAAFLVLLRLIEQTGPNRFLVESEDGLKAYEVENGHCNCYDYLNHGIGHPCKHRLALSIIGYISLEANCDSSHIPKYSTIESD